MFMLSRIFVSSPFRSTVTTIRSEDEISEIISFDEWNVPTMYSSLSFRTSDLVASALEYMIAAIAENVSGFETEAALPAISSPVFETMEALWTGLSEVNSC